MKKIQGSKETYYLLSQVSKLVGIDKKTIYNYAVKLKTRFYKFSSRRFIEKSDLICVLESIKLTRSDDEKNTIDRYLETLL